jgi:predicted glycosyltransferase
MALNQLGELNQFVPMEPQRSRARNFAFHTRAALKLVPDITTDNSTAVSNRAFIGFLIGVFTIGLLLLLSVNTALTSGAFTLENMKLQLAAVNDQRDALLNQVARYSSPDNLAVAALKMGMQPQAAINFLDINGSSGK